MGGAGVLSRQSNRNEPEVKNSRVLCDRTAPQVHSNRCPANCLVMKRTLFALASIAAFSPVGSAIAAMPDVETYTYVTKKYNLLIRETRDSCAFYTDPNFVVVTNERNIRKLIVLQTQSKRGGTACNGVFQFHYADVNCQTNQILFTNGVGSPASWKYEQYFDPATTKRICALPVVEFGVPNRRPTAK